MNKRMVELLVVSALIVALAAATVYAVSWYYLLRKTATVTVEVNDYAVELYSDPSGSTVSSSVAFPNVKEGDLSGSTVESVTCYLFLKNGASESRDVNLFYNVTGLPEGSSIMGYITDSNGRQVYWYPNLATGLIPISVLNKGLDGNAAYWTLTYNSLSADTYTFTINIYCGD